MFTYEKYMLIPNAKYALACLQRFFQPHYMEIVFVNIEFQVTESYSMI